MGNDQRNRNLNPGQRRDLLEYHRINKNWVDLAELTHWKGLWCWEGLGAGGEGDDRGWEGWMVSLTWVWVNSRSFWWTGRPGVLRFMGSQRIGHDWVTELNWTEHTRSVHKPNNSLTVTELRSHEERLAWWINGYGNQPSRWPQENHISWYSHPCVLLAQTITVLRCETKQTQKWRCVTSGKRLCNLSWMQVLFWITHSGRRQQPPYKQPLGEAHRGNWGLICVQPSERA